ncbi:hypothetical protein GIB67_010972 [Kingdonia uniflora]|uniref:Pulmonary surfactant-associated protein B n=1 Tax=Kingdonia uniflora TaxID=39325 RepID=A0A7J7MMV7_9MAGN|nr:hypothetical protein GIB67_010972 [Kingdonia uniflora]
MDARLGLLFLLMLGISWVHVEARSLVVSDATGMQINYEGPKSESETIKVDRKNEDVCTLCEEFASQAVYYFGENKTQLEIIDTLHLACSKIRSFKTECIALVDYYAPFFFVEIALVQPEDFCRKVNLCNQMVLASGKTCELCNDAVAEVLDKLEDPDTQLEVVATLLKVCNSLDNNAMKKKCKKLVFAYGPLILTDASQLLNKLDFCKTIHACKTSADERQTTSALVKTMPLSDF